MIIRSIETKDHDRVMEIYTYYILNSMAAYLDEIPSIDFLFNGVYEGGFLVIEIEDKVVGFGKIKKYHTSDVFKHTALVGYFLDPSFSGRGLGKVVLEGLEKVALKKGVKHLLAHVSSVNEASQKFHKKNGFIECGHFPQMGVKFGKSFDLIWYSKNINTINF